MEKFLKNQQIPLTQVIDPSTGQTYYAPQNVVYDEKNNNGPQYLRNVIVDQAVSASYFSGSVSNAVSASYASTASYLLGSVASASFATSASYARTASYAQNIIISGSINNVDYIDFNTGSAIPAWKSGRVYWDNTEGALSVYNAEADISLQIGQENWTRIFNDTGVTILNGTIVRLSGSHGDVPTVTKAQSIAVSGAINLFNQILGVATHDIEHGGFGYITTQGLVHGLNTNALTEGSIIFVSQSAGLLTTTPPSPPYEIIPVGVCVKQSPGGSGIIYVAVSQPTDFSDLSSAEVGTYNFGDIWVYKPSGSLGVWNHTKQLSGSYGLTGSLNATSFTGSLFGTASYASQALSSSYAITSSYVLNAISASFASTASFVQTAQTASYVLTAQTASYVLNAVSASRATTSSFAITSSYVLNAVSASFASTASFVQTAQTASYVLNAISASFASTASFVNPLTQSVAITGSLTVNGNNTTTGTTTLGNGTFTKAGFNVGDVLIDNNSTDTPGVLFYYANNSNYGIDSWNGSFDVLSGQLVRITNKLNETGGAVKMALDTSGNVVFTGFVKANAWRAGQVINDIILSNTEVTISTTTIATSTSDTDFLRYDYTPLSSTSYLVIHYHLASYDFTGGTGNDSYFSRIKVDSSEITYAYQSTVNGFRTGVLFPLTGRYTNTSTTAKRITVAARRDSADDSITIVNSSTSMWLRITEIAR